MSRAPGQQNKDKPFRDALRMEIASAQGDDDFKSLRCIARKLLYTAWEGDTTAIKEIADRLDGKVPSVINGDENGGPVTVQVLTGVPRD